MPNTRAADADPSLLDNPVWHALTGPHRRFAVETNGNHSAYRYRVDVSPFAALRDVTDPQAWQDLATLTAPEGRAALEAHGVTAVPPGWTVTNVFPVAQMIAPDSGLTTHAAPDPIVPLGKPDAAEMMTLAELVSSKACRNTPAI